MSNVVENYINKNMLSTDAQQKLAEKVALDSKKALQGMTGMDVEEYSKLVERAVAYTQEEVDKLSMEEIDKILGPIAVKFIDTHIKATNAKKEYYKRDYIKLIIEQDEFDRGIDGATDILNKQNEEFMQQLNKLIDEMKSSSVPYTTTLMEIINNPESDPNEVFTAKEMIKGINYVTDLSFLATNNNKRLVKIINNEKEYARLKTKAIKLLNRENYGEPIKYNTLETKLLELINLDGELSKLDESFKIKIVLVITTKFYVQVAKTKRLDTFTKTFMLYFKIYVLSIGSNANIPGAPEFLTALEEYIRRAAKLS